MTTTTIPATLFDYDVAGTKTGCKDNEKSRITETQLESFATVQETRKTERSLALQFFFANPSKSFSRQDLCEEVRLPINHICRIVRDLLDENAIMVVGKALNPRSMKMNEALCLTPKTLNLFGYE